MMAKVLNLLFKDKPPELILLYCLLLVAFDSLVDYLTGYEMTYFVFYILPVAIAAWYGSHYMGWAIAIVSGIAWLAVDLIDGHPYSQPWYPYWNGGVRLSFFLLISQLVTSVRLLLELEKSMAREDALTGIPNRLAFKESCDVLFPLASRNRSPMALGLIDIDNFSRLNERYGHGFGDEVLRAVAAMLKDAIRKTDVFGRIVGNEFAVLLPNTDPETAREWFAALHRSLSLRAEEDGLPIGFSIGVAVIENPDISTEQAMRFANELVHRVKKSEQSSLLCEEYDHT